MEQPYQESAYTLIEADKMIGSSHGPQKTETAWSGPMVTLNLEIWDPDPGHRPIQPLGCCFHSEEEISIFANR
ncbi:hypothetical protein F1880_007331 [Penicillium rolfsii]|nr:hypothetical protein F1880_007331 [Penicillium rolfsii]